MGEKIMYFMDFPLNIGGASRVLLMQANIIQKRGYEVLIVIPNDKLKGHAAEYDQICKKFGLTTVSAVYYVATSIEQIAIIDAVEHCEVIKRLVEEYHPDLIHSAQLNISAELAARELNIPHLMNIYQADVNEFFVDWLNVYPQYHLADSCLFSERWKRGLGIPSRCIRVAYEKKEISVQKSRWAKKKSINIISIGTLCERKNQIEIMKFALLCKNKGQEIQLIFLGKCDNPYGDRCRKYAEENGLQNNVLFAGYVLNIEDYLCGADLFILSSKVESYPGVIVESMANNVPVISTPVAGVPELVRDGENGFLTDGYQGNDIYNTFVRFLKYKESGMLVSIIENAYNTYQEYHTCYVVGNQLEEYYQWIIHDYHKKNEALLKAEDIRQIFCQYAGGDQQDITTEEVRRSIWFLYHVFLIWRKKSNKKVAIWGAGLWGSIFLKWLHYLGGNTIEIVGFIDMYKQGDYLGYPIIQDRDYMIKKCGTIFVAVLNQKDQLNIMAYLDERGKVRNRDYFMAINGPIRI